LRCERYF